MDANQTTTVNMALTCTEVTGECDPDDPNACVDGNDCTRDGTCNGESLECEGGSNELEATPCGTGGVCDGQGRCVECNGPQQCDDSNECTDDTCGAGSCNHDIVAGRLCDYMGLSQGGLCNQQGQCAEAPQNCPPGHCPDTGNDCTENLCNPSDGSCSPSNVVGACEDAPPGGNPGNCSSGVCVGLCVGKDCKAQDECQDDSTCNPSTGACLPFPNKGNGTPCSLGTCQGGVCRRIFPCTEQGIRDAIAAGGGPYTFACVGPTTVLTGAEIIINNDVTLDGEGNLTVDGNDDHRVLSVSAGITTELVGMTVTRGRLPQTSEQGGGILNEGTLTITNSTVASNGTPGDDSGGGAEGGGIYNSGTLTLEDSAVRENGAWEGCGIYNTGTATLINSDVSQNGGPYPSYVWSGSGIRSIGTLTLIDTVVTLNEDGGGVAAAINSWGTMTLINSAVLDNVSSQSAAVGSSGSATLINSTVSGNSGGIASGNEIWGGTLTLINSTVVAHQWGLAIDIYGELIATNSIIVGRLPVPPVDHACGFPGGSSTSGGGNIESPGDSCGFDQPTDQVNVSAADLNLSPLADNGGPTMTHALLPGSVAIDHIPASMCLDENGDPLTTDQRGEPRPETGGDSCDVGSFEVQP